MLLAALASIRHPVAREPSPPRERLSARRDQRSGLRRTRRRALPAQPTSAAGVGAYGRTGRPVPPQATGPASLAEYAVCRQPPEVGAVCGNSARTDLCGGRSAMGVPTANTKVLALKTHSLSGAEIRTVSVPVVKRVPKWGQPPPLLAVCAEFTRGVSTKRKSGAIRSRPRAPALARGGLRGGRAIRQLSGGSVASEKPDCCVALKERC